MFNHENLDIWRRSLTLTVNISQSLERSGRTSLPGTRSQLIRACAAVPSNIAEASGQQSPAQTARFLDIAIGSLNETQSHLSLACATGAIRAELAEKFVDEVRQLRRMTASFKKWVLSKSVGNDSIGF